MSSASFSASSQSPRPSLVLLHGATLNGRMWDPVRRHLDPRWNVVTPDLPGHGARRAEPFTLDAAVATVVDTVRSLAPAPVVVGGDSLGGFVTLASASALPPSQLRGLVPSGSTMNFEGAALWPYYLRIAANKLLVGVLGEQRILGPGMIKKLGEMGMEEGDARAMLEAGINMRVFPVAVKALTGIDFRAKLAAIEQPVLLVNGSRDPDMIRTHDSFLAAARHGSGHVFPGVEHGVSVRRSAEFAALLNAFAERVFAEARA